MAKAQPSPYPFHHRLPIQMRFNDIDMLGHINNSIYMQYMDLGKVDYIKTVLGKVFNFHKESMIIANINCNFYSPIRFDESIEVLTRTDTIGEYSFTLEQRVVNKDTQEAKCVSHVVMVGYDVDDCCKIPISEEWKKLLSEYEHRTL